MTHKFIIGIIFAYLFIPVHAQDAANSLPKVYKTIFENPYVRVQAVHYEPHVKLPEHDHTAYPTAYVYINDAGPVIYKHRGLSYGAVTRPAVKAGSFRLYVAVQEIHTVESLSATPSDFLRVELKTETGANPNSLRGKYFRLEASPQDNWQQVQFENEQIRITRVLCAPTKSCAGFAATANPTLLVALTDAHFKPIHLPTGKVLWLEPQKGVQATNTSKAAAEFLRFEFKTQPLKNAPATAVHNHANESPTNAAKEQANQEAARLLVVGVALHNEGKMSESIATQEQALKLNPGLVQAYINLMSLYGQTEQFAKAVTSYQAALAINPDIPEIHFNYGVLLTAQENLAAAEQAFARCLTLNPYYAEAQYNFAAIIERSGRLDEAAQHYRKAIANKTNYTAAHFALGRILINQNQFDEAIAAFKLSLTPADEFTPRNLYALGATYIRAGNHTEGIKYLREASKQAKSLHQDALANSIERDLTTLEQK